LLNTSQEEWWKMVRYLKRASPQQNYTFWIKSKLLCVCSSVTIRFWRKFRQYLIIEEQENLDNHGELEDFKQDA